MHERPQPPESTEKIKGLSIQDFAKVAEAAHSTVRERGQEYYGWVDAPAAENDGTLSHTTGRGENRETTEVSGAEALGIYKKKLDGAYGERFITSLGTIAGLIRNGYNVRFVQFQSEEGVPFDAEGWTVMVVDSMPIFHVSPEDLQMAGLEDLVEILPDNNAPDVSWKNTNKVGEFDALLRGSLEPGLDLVQIAQDSSVQEAD